MSSTGSTRDGARPPRPMRLGRWRRRVHPLILDKVMDTTESGKTRERVCARVAGDVLEIGFGTGLNVPHLPVTVRRLLAVEPVERSWELAATRVAAATVPVEYLAADARALPLADHSVDAVLSTWSLCSIDDPVLAVAEVARVLRPGGRLHFVEHGRADDQRVRRWQHRCDPLWSRLSCGCHLDRDVPSILEAGGLHITEITRSYAESEPKFVGFTFEGTASVPGAARLDG